jgi:hypothetical protein
LVRILLFVLFLITIGNIYHHCPPTATEEPPLITTPELSTIRIFALLILFVAIPMTVFLLMLPLDDLDGKIGVTILLVVMIIAWMTVLGRTPSRILAVFTGLLGVGALVAVVLLRVFISLLEWTIE